MALSELIWLVTGESSSLLRKQ